MFQLMKMGSFDRNKNKIFILILRFSKNYIQKSTQHLPGVIEIDALDSFKMLSRRIGRIEKSNILFPTK